MSRRLGLVASFVLFAAAATACGSSAPAADEAPASVKAPASYQQFDINHVLSTGQGNAIATDASPPITVAQPYSNLKFDTGVIPARQCDEIGCKAYAKPSGFVPLIEGDAFFLYGVETMSSGLANEAAKLAGERRHDVLVSVHGRNGSTYRCLRKGGCELEGAALGYVPSFDDALLEVQDAKSIADAAGKTYVVRAVTAMHGEADHVAYASGHSPYPMPATTNGGLVASYAEAMIEWQRDYESAVQAISGQTLPVPLLLLQMSNWSAARQSVIPSLMLQAHVDAPGKVVVVTPGYPIGYADDCVHFTNHGQRRLGEYFGKAYARIVIEGKPWEPLRPIAITRNGKVITAKFLVPRPPLVLDTDHVSNPGSYGFELADGSSAPPAIRSVVVTGEDTVEITLARAPSGPDPRLRYAYTAKPGGCSGFENGPRGNLRDSDETPSNHGYALWNWSVHFDERVE